jgi:hypothetical protein
VNFADARQNKSCPFLFGAQPFFGLHIHMALQQACGARPALALTAAKRNRNAYGLRKLQKSHVREQFKLESRAQKFNKGN